jgi:Flp pilus assembly protein TadG
MKRISAMRGKIREFFSDQRGAAVVVTALGLVGILGVAGLAVDLGHLYVVKSELQRAADAGALAGAQALFSVAQPSTPQCSAALAKGTEIAQANLVEGSIPTLATIQTGYWNWSSSTWTQGCSANPFTNAVKVTTGRDNISLIFMGVLGRGPGNLQATAIAGKGWVNNLNPGYGFVLAVGKKYVKTGPLDIYLNDDKSDQGAWYAKDQKPNNNLIRGYLENPSTIPGIQKGDTINLNNGVWKNVLSIIASNYIGQTVWLPVVDTVKFNQSATVLGFTGFQITAVDEKGKKCISGVALGLAEAPGTVSAPGGSDYGLLTSTRLVQKNRPPFRDD